MFKDDNANYILGFVLCNQEDIGNYDYRYGTSMVGYHKVENSKVYIPCYVRQIKVKDNHASIDYGAFLQDITVN